MSNNFTHMRFDEQKRGRCDSLWAAAAAAAKSLQSCPTLWDPIDGSPAGSPSLGFFRQEYWSGLPFPSPMHESEKSKWSCSVMSLATSWTAAHQAPLSMGFSRQEYWSGGPLPSPLCELLADNCSKQGYSFAATEVTHHCTASWQEHMHCATKYKTGASILRYKQKIHAEKREQASAMKQGQTEAKAGVLCERGRGWKTEPDPFHIQPCSPCTKKKIIT